MTKKDTPVKEEQKSTPVQAIPMGEFPESPVTATIKLYTPGGKDVMITARSGATQEDVMYTIDALMLGVKYGIETYGLLDVPKTQPAPAATSAPAISSDPEPASTPPVLTGNAPGIHTLTFQAEQLVSEIKENGKKYWKIKGPPFRQYGVRVWDEVLVDFGWNLADLTESTYALGEGYTAHYTEKSPGKPEKVTKLVFDG
jgi:hypothetical protein